MFTGQPVDGAADGLNSLVGVTGPRERTTKEPDRGGEPSRVLHQVHRLPQRSDRRLRCAEPQLRRGELYEQLSPEFRRGPLRERPAQPCGGRLRRAAPERLGRHAAQQLDSSQVAGGLRLHDLRSDPLLTATGCLEQVRGVRVRHRALRDPDVRVDRLANYRVHELEAVGRLEDREVGEQVGRTARLGHRQLGELGCLGHRRAVAEDRDGPYEGRSGRRPAR